MYTKLLKYIENIRTDRKGVRSRFAIMWHGVERSTHARLRKSMRTPKLGEKHAEIKS